MRLTSHSHLHNSMKIASNGTNPQTGGRGSPTNASRFFNSTDMESALRQAEAMYAANPSEYRNGIVPVTFNRPVGDGFMGGTRENNTAGVSGQYRWTNTINVGIERSTGRPFTAYPNLKDGQVKPDPLTLR